MGEILFVIPFLSDESQKCHYQNERATLARRKKKREKIEGVKSQGGHCCRSPVIWSHILGGSANIKFPLIHAATNQS